MHPLSRALFVAVPPALLALGFLEHLLTPMAPRRWIAWFALSAVAAGLVLSSLRPMALKRRHRPLRAPLPALDSPRGAGAALKAAAALAAVYYLLVLALPGKGPLAVSQSFHMGQWVIFGFMPAAAAAAGDKGVGWGEALLSLLVALIPVLLCLPSGDYYSARVWLVSLIPVYVLVSGNRRLKILAAAAAILYAACGFLAVRFEARWALPLYSWLFAGPGGLYGSYLLSLQHAVYELSGAWGAGHRYIPMVGLVRPWDMPLNGIPYLSLWLGVPAARAAVAALALVLIVAFVELMSLRSPARRAAAAGLWFLSAVNVYVAVLALFSPEFLAVSLGSWGIPYFGSFESALQLHLTLLLIFTGDAFPPARLGEALPAASLGTALAGACAGVPPAAEASPAAGAEASEATPEAEAEASEDMPGAEAEASEDMPGAEAEASEDMPGAEAEASEATPGAEAEASEATPGAEAEASEATPGAEAEASQRAEETFQPEESEAPERISASEKEPRAPAPSDFPEKDRQGPARAGPPEAERQAPAVAGAREAAHQAPARDGASGEETRAPYAPGDRPEEPPEPAQEGAPEEEPGTPATSGVHEADPPRPVAAAGGPGAERCSGHAPEEGSPGGDGVSAETFLPGVG
ncbi:MAG: hypothetical protein LBW85_04595 [Deltaproteobacteria bacterium]|jgi:hypothetical protein|nr:hypothetical protein [Deltaproteobacteria bacterium]